MLGQARLGVAAARRSARRCSTAREAPLSTLALLRSRLEPSSALSTLPAAGGTCGPSPSAGRMPLATSCTAGTAVRLGSRVGSLQAHRSLLEVWGWLTRCAERSRCWATQHGRGCRPPGLGMLCAAGRSSSPRQAGTPCRACTTGRSAAGMITLCRSDPGLTVSRSEPQPESSSAGCAREASSRLPAAALHASGQPGQAWSHTWRCCSSTRRSSCAREASDRRLPAASPEASSAGSCTCAVLYSAASSSSSLRLSSQEPAHAGHAQLGRVCRDSHAVRGGCA